MDKTFYQIGFFYIFFIFRFFSHFPFGYEIIHFFENNIFKNK